MNFLVLFEEKLMLPVDGYTGIKISEADQLNLQNCNKSAISNLILLAFEIRILEIERIFVHLLIVKLSFIASAFQNSNFQFVF